MNAIFPLCPWWLNISGSLLNYQTQNKCYSLALKVFCQSYHQLSLFKPGLLPQKFWGLAGMLPLLQFLPILVRWLMPETSSPSDAPLLMLSFRTQKKTSRSLSWPVFMPTVLVHMYSVGQHLLSTTHDSSSPSSANIYWALSMCLAVC